MTFRRMIRPLCGHCVSALSPVDPAELRWRGPLSLFPSSNHVSEGGLEPPRPCGHQPLKLARLPIPPLRLARLGGSPRRKRSWMLSQPDESSALQGRCPLITSRLFDLKSPRRYLPEEARGEGVGGNPDCRIGPSYDSWLCEQWESHHICP